MKTAEEYWDEHMAPSGLAHYGGLSYSHRRQAADAMVAANRSDALADKSVAPDADEERAKREHDRFQSFLPESYRMEFEAHCDETIAAWKAYSKTLPPRPVRSPGERLHDAYEEIWDSTLQGQFDGLNPERKERYERAATSLGIKPQE